MSLMRVGTILCNKCHAPMDLKKEVCPKCNNTHCYVALYWQGRHFKYRRDDKTGEIFRCAGAAAKLIEINKAIKASRKAFDPATWTDATVRERRFEYQLELYRGEMEKAYDAGEWSYGHYTNLTGYQKKYYPFFDGKDVREIGLQDLKQFASSLSGKSKTKKNILGMLHRFFHWLFDKGVIAVIPAFPEVKGGDEARRKALRRTEQMMGLESIPSEHRGIIEFMMHTGCRPSEAIAIQIRSIEVFMTEINGAAVEAGVIWLEQRRDGYKRYRPGTKNQEKDPFVPLNGTALEIVKRNMKGKFPKDFLFINSNTGKPYTGWCLWDNWKRLSGADGTLYEATRHSYCSQIVPKARNAKEAQRLMRHKDAKSTERYYHAYADDLIRVARDIDNVVELAEKRNEKGTPSNG